MAAIDRHSGRFFKAVSRKIRDLRNLEARYTA